MVSGKKMEQKDFPVLEMSCAACAISVATVLKEIPGVSEADVNYANQSARVVFDASLIKPEQLQLAVRKAGYDLVIEPSAEEQQAIQKQAQLKTSKELREKTLLSILFTIPVVVLGMLMMDWYWGKIISLLLTTPVIFYFGRNYFIHAYKQALLKRARKSRVKSKKSMSGLNQPVQHQGRNYPWGYSLKWRRLAAYLNPSVTHPRR